MNIESVLHDLSQRKEDYWIDMETGVRTDDVFDLAKVQKILEVCYPEE